MVELIWNGPYFNICINRDFPGPGWVAGRRHQPPLQPPPLQQPDRPKQLRRRGLGGRGEAAADCHDGRRQRSAGLQTIQPGNQSINK